MRGLRLNRIRSSKGNLNSIEKKVTNRVRFPLIIRPIKNFLANGANLPQIGFKYLRKA